MICVSYQLGGMDIKTLDLPWFHKKISIVSQEPTLFACSIRDNIAYGRSDATDPEVEAAAKQANGNMPFNGAGRWFHLI